MHQKDKPKQIIQNIDVIDAGSDGQAVGKWNDYVVFIKNAVPGDVVDVQITRKKRRYAEAKVIEYVKLSDKRTKPECEHFGICGGCKWQNMNYENQLYYKQKQVADALQRIGKIPLPEIMPIIPSQRKYYYRNKLEYTFSNKMWLTEEQIESKAEFSNRNALGFHIPGMFDKVLDINNCYLQEEPSNSIRLEIKKYALEKGVTFFDLKNQTGLLRTLLIRTASTGEVMVVPVFYENNMEAIEDILNHLNKTFPQITSLMYVINSKRNDTISDQNVILYKGNPFLMEEMEGLKFKVGPKSFYQTNSQQAHELYKVAREFADFKGNETVYDLYTGTGTIANFVAGKAGKVVGIEYIEPAIADAKENSLLNNIRNTVFYSGDIKDVLNADFINANGKPSIIITDPPRVGMHEDVTLKIKKIAPEKIVYVSCNPSTQARDILLLSENYVVSKIQPVDMFPQTHHVENVVLLVKKDNQ